MTKYKVEFTRPAARQLAKLPKGVQRRVGTKIDALAQNPRPRGAVKLAGENSIYRVRAGDYRIVYDVQDRALTISIVKVAHRKDVYRDFS